jgi:hypothetical protein
MGSYGRNFDFRIAPQWNQRLGRYVLAEGAAIPIGAPVEIAAAATQSDDFTGALPATLATGATTTPRRGFGGIAVYEHLDLNQLDPLYATYSDRDTVPDGKLFQVVSGEGIKVCFRNTVARTFLETRDYDGRIMVAGFGATPTLAVGDLLTPGTGNNSAGYWAETADATMAWMVITGLDHDRSEIEAMLLF